MYFSGEHHGKSLVERFHAGYSAGDGWGVGGRRGRNPNPLKILEKARALRKRGLYIIQHDVKGSGGCGEGSG